MKIWNRMTHLDLRPVPWSNSVPVIGEAEWLRRVRLQRFRNTYTPVEHLRQTVQLIADIVWKRFPAWLLQYEIFRLASGPNSEIRLLPHALPGGYVTCGRSSEVSIRLDDPKVSAVHARFFFEQDVMMLEDLGSRNGTFINEKRLTPNQPMQFYDQDRLLLGCTRLRVKKKISPAHEGKAVVEGMSFSVGLLSERLMSWMMEAIVVAEDSRTMSPMLLVIPSDLICLLIDRYMGIPNQGDLPPVYVPSRLDRFLAVSFARTVFKDLRSSDQGSRTWNLTGISWNEKSSMFPDGQTSFVWFDFELVFDGFRFRMTAGLPESSMVWHDRGVIAMDEMPAISRLLVKIGSIQTRCRLIAGGFTVSLNDLRGLEPGDVILMNDCGLIADENGGAAGCAYLEPEGLDRMISLKGFIRAGEGIYHWGFDELMKREGASMDEVNKVTKKIEPDDQDILKQAPIQESICEGISVTCAVVLTHLTISLRELAGLKQGDILSLERYPADPVLLTCGNSCLGEGRLIMIGSQIGLEMTRVKGADEV